MQLYAKGDDGWPDYNRPIDPTPARPEAAALAAALSSLREAEDALNKAKGEVPDYIPVGSPKDFYSEEQEAYNRAADALEDAVLAIARRA